jgi:hypothetical protein
MSETEYSVRVGAQTISGRFEGDPMTEAEQLRAVAKELQDSARQLVGEKA